MKRNKQLFAGLAAIFVVGAPSLIAGCDPHLSTRSSVSSVTVIAIDPSAEEKAHYVQDLHSIIWSAEPGSVIFVYPITNNTQATAERGFTLVLPTYNPMTTNEDVYKKDLAAARSSALGKAERLLSTSSCPATDLIHAFTPAANELKGSLYRNCPNERLVIMSDAVQQSSDLDFLEIALTKGRDQSIIATLSSHGGLPNLRGVSVWVDGAGATSDGRIRPEKLAEIEQFWLAYFDRAHATLPVEQYGARLQNYAL